jgi:small subunit ribosomal protein S20
MKTRVRNTVKAVRAAVQLKDKDQAMALLGTASSILDKAATKGVIHWKNASRNISRLSKAISQI